MKREDVYQVSDEDFIAAIKCSSNIHEALKKMKLNGRGAAYKTFRKRVAELNVDLTHFIDDKKRRKELTDNQIVIEILSSFSRQETLKKLKLNPFNNSSVKWIDNKINTLNINIEHWLGLGHLKNKKHSWNERIPIENILVENSEYTATSVLKKKLVNLKLLDYKCYECDLTQWNNKEIVLQLEHKNGDNKDNRIENLCFLCPNCHSQTDTFAGKNIGRRGGN